MLPNFLRSVVYKVIYGCFGDAANLLLCVTEKWLSYLGNVVPFQISSTVPRNFSFHFPFEFLTPSSMSGKACRPAPVDVVLSKFTCTLLLSSMCMLCSQESRPSYSVSYVEA
jgi:hypothetical protein